MNRINKNNRETEIMDGLKCGTVVGKQMTNNKSLVWQNFSLLFDATDSEKYFVMRCVKRARCCSSMTGPKVVLHI